MIKRISTITSFVCIFKAFKGRASFKKGQSSQFTGALAKETKQKVQFGNRNRHLKHLPTGNKRVEKCCLPRSARDSKIFMGFAERKIRNISPISMKIFLCGLLERTKIIFLLFVYTCKLETLWLPLLQSISVFVTAASGGWCHLPSTSTSLFGHRFL